MNLANMALIRKIVLGLLLAASAAVLLMAALELWNYREWAYLYAGEPAVNSGSSAGILRDHIDLLSKRVGDMELLVLILLGTSGLYAIVFVASSYLTANGFARQADRTVVHIKDEIGLAMGDLRELQEKTEQRLREMTVAPAVAAPVEQPNHEPAPPRTAAALEHQIAEISERVSSWQGEHLGEQARRALVQDEYTAVYLELTAGAQAEPEILSALADLFLAFGRIYASSDVVRSRFYLEHALYLAEPGSALLSEIHYELACHFAGSHDFVRAMRELSGAFAHQLKTLDERLAGDIDEGGKLYELASTAPFDKAVNDLLLNVSIGIG